MRAGESCWIAGFGSFYDASTITNANASILEPDIYGYENRFGEIETKSIADRDCRKSKVSSSGFRYGQMFCSGLFTCHSGFLKRLFSPYSSESDDLIVNST